MKGINLLCVLPIILMLNIGFTKLITVSNHKDTVAMYNTEEIFDIQLAGGKMLFIYFYKYEDNPKIIPATKYSRREIQYERYLAHESYVFENFNDALAEYTKIIDELNGR